MRKYLYIANNKAKVAVVRADKDVTNDNTKVAAVQHKVPTSLVELDLGGGGGLLCPLVEREEALVARKAVVLRERRNSGAGCGRRCSRGTRLVGIAQIRPPGVTWCPQPATGVPNRRGTAFLLVLFWSPCVSPLFLQSSSLFLSLNRA